MLLWVSRPIILLQIRWSFRTSGNRDHHYIMCEGITIIHILRMVISCIVAVNVALERINIRPIMLLLWVLVGIGIVLVISSTEVLLRMVV